MARLCGLYDPLTCSGGMIASVSVVLRSALMKIVLNDARTLQTNSLERYLRAWRTLRLHDRRGAIRAVVIGSILLLVSVVIVLRLAER